jgi:uncharacterized protein (DUF1697 family)
LKQVGVFLRAVNLPGGRLLMDDFKRVLAKAGYPGAQTVVATGNAVISAKGSDGGLETAIEAALAGEFGGAIEVFTRDAGELAAIVAGNPFAPMALSDPSHLVVVFLRAQPSAEAVAALQAKIKGGEVVTAGPRCLYACYFDGIGTSKLTAAMIERALKDRGTARNWNTVRRMAELTGAA